MCIISGSTHLLAEVWSGKAHYYLHGIGIDLGVSYAKGKSIALSIPPTPSSHYNGTHTLERLPVISYTLAPHGINPPSPNNI